VLPPVAMADLPMSPEALGQVEGVLGFCARVDPGAKTRYEQQAEALRGAASRDDLEEARKSDAYRGAFDAVSEQLAKVDAASAVKTCRESAHGR